MAVNKFRRRTEYVEAIRVTRMVKAQAALMRWLESFGIEVTVLDDHFVRIKHPAGLVQYAQVGQHVVRDPYGEISVMTDEIFRHRFTE